MWDIELLYIYLDPSVLNGLLVDSVLSNRSPILTSGDELPDLVDVGRRKRDRHRLDTQDDEKQSTPTSPNTFKQSVPVPSKNINSDGGVQSEQPKRSLNADISTLPSTFPLYVSLSSCVSTSNIVGISASQLNTEKNMLSNVNQSNHINNSHHTSHTYPDLTYSLNSVATLTPSSSIHPTSQNRDTTATTIVGYDSGGQSCSQTTLSNNTKQVALLVYLFY